MQLVKNIVYHTKKVLFVIFSFSIIGISTTKSTSIIKLQNVMNTGRYMPTIDLRVTRSNVKVTMTLSMKIFSDRYPKNGLTADHHTSQEHWPWSVSPWYTCIHLKHYKKYYIPLFVNYNNSLRKPRPRVLLPFIAKIFVILYAINFVRLMQINFVYCLLLALGH